MSLTITKQIVQQQLKKQPDVDKENSSIELYCADYKNKSSVHPSTNTKSYVFNGNKLFFEGYPYSIELDQAAFEPGRVEVAESGFDFAKCKFFEAHEGTLVRVFNIDGKWYTSTNRRLDAFNSKWAAKTTTFGLHFAEAVQSLIDEDIFEDDEEENMEKKKQNARAYLNNMYEANLDKTKKYMFLLEPSKEERIVCLTTNPRFFNIGVFDANNKLSLEEDVFFNDCVVAKPKHQVFNDEREMVWALDNVNIDQIQGFIAIQSEEGREDKHFKLLNGRYKYLFSIRGSTPSIRFRYLELEHMNTTINLQKGLNQQTVINTEKMLDDFFQLYNFNPSSIRNYIWCKVVDDLFQKYQEMYVKKTFIDPNISIKVSDMLKTIHLYYKESGFTRRTDRTRIADILAFQKPSMLNQLIAEYEKKDKDALREIKLTSM